MRTADEHLTCPSCRAHLVVAPGGNQGHEERRHLPLKELAVVVGLPARMLRRLVRRGELPYVEGPRRAYLACPEDIFAWLDANKTRVRSSGGDVDPFDEGIANGELTETRKEGESDA